MLLVGLTGGIGSGKSTVARLLAERGAAVLDADSFARDAVRAGSPGFDAVVARFGDGLIGSDGELNREALAAIVFADEAARHDLESIVHPEVRRRIGEGISANAGTDTVVVLESPLLIETGADRDCDVVVVVAAPAETQIDRLTAAGMSETDARARMAAQSTLEEKAAQADVVLDNEGTLDELEAQMDSLWADLRSRAAARE
ncbi:MAG: dephospho-CoA kinase [Actinomycetota bacterium]|nr:dephospho-CoA kinase [Actinomycetota bacterium]